MSVSSASAYDLETAYIDNYVNGSEFLEINTNDVSDGWNVTKKAFTSVGDECFNNTTTDDEFLALYKSRNALDKTNDGELKKEWVKSKSLIVSLINKSNNTNITTEHPIKNGFDTIGNHTNDTNIITLPLYTILIVYKIVVNAPVSKLMRSFTNIIKYSTEKELLTSIH